MQTYRAYAFVVQNKYYTEDLIDGLFTFYYRGARYPHDNIIYLDKIPYDIYDLLIISGTYKSKGQARKNWRWNDHSCPEYQKSCKIPNGYSYFYSGRHLIEILVPVQTCPICGSLPHNGQLCFNI